MHFCFFRLLPVSLSFRLPGSCLSILIFVHFAYCRSFRLSSFISPELYSGIGSSEPPYIDQAWSIPRLSLSSFISPELYSGIGSSEPPYIDHLLSRHISTKLGRSPVSPFLLSFRPNCIRASALLSRHISTKLGRSPVSPFLLSFRPNDIRLHRHRSKTAFFSPLIVKKIATLLQISLFLCTFAPTKV